MLVQGARWGLLRRGLVMCDRVGVTAAAQTVIPGNTLRERGTAAALEQTKPELWLLWPHLGVMIELKLS